MTRSLKPWMAWAAAGATVLFVTIYLLLYISHPEAPREETPFQAFTWVLEPIAFAALGTLLAVRRPENPMGWLFTVIAVGLSAPLLGDYALVSPRGTGARWIGWFSEFSWVPLSVGTVFACLLYPTGAFLSDLWRWVGRIMVAGAILVVVGIAFSPGPMSEYPALENPVGIPALGGSLLDGGGIAWILFVLAVAASILSVILRFVRSRGDERLQLKWFSFATALLALSWAYYGVLAVRGELGGLAEEIASLAIDASILMMPVAIAIAILRYRLYDIDRIINRAIVYAVVTGSLVAVYAGIVFVAGTIVVDPGDNFTVAVATLAAAAMFRPLLRRVQGFVDRRFYRYKYDAQQTVDDFGVRLRAQTDLEYLTHHLVGVVRTTMQPAHVSLWLREPEGAR